MSLYLGNTPIADSGNSRADTDLSNLTSTGQNIANWSSNVTNCITEIPQDIKLELNNGTLTLKAGSKVYVPNGSGVFDEVTISSDLTASTSGTASKLLFYNRTTNALDHWNTGDCKSGTAWSGVEGVFYNTSMNTIKYTVNSGSTWNAEYSLPIGIATTDGGFVSIDQVFNGFGYIGSTVFALPGVKGLIPNGRNADGTLRNIEITVENVITYGRNLSQTDVPLWLISNGSLVFSRGIHYDEKLNFVLNNNNTPLSLPRGQVLTSDLSSGVISNFTPKTAFHAVDYNDSSTISGWSMPSGKYITLTAGAHGSSYIAPAHGYFCVQGYHIGGSIQNVFSIINATTGIGSSTIPPTLASSVATLSIEARKGDTVRIYNYGGTFSSLIFVYAEGEN